MKNIKRYIPSQNHEAISRDRNLGSIFYRNYKNPLYVVWLGMMQRCYLESRKDYGSYGGRGISVAEDWHNFDNFVIDMADSYDDNLSLDRINNQLGYSNQTQCNNRRTNHWIFDDVGNKYTVSELSICISLGHHEK